MVELNPRPSRPNLFVQVAVAVVSGAAAMNFLQNFRSGPAVPAVPSSREAVKKADEPVPLAPEPAPPPIDPTIKPIRFASQAPAESSMMLVPEAGGATGGVVSVGDDAPAPAVRDQIRAAAAKKKTVGPSGAPIVHLQKNSMRQHVGPTVGHGFDAPQLNAKVYARPEEPEPEAPPQAAPPPVKTLSAPLLFDEKKVAPKDQFTPSLIHPEVVPETPFWDAERKRKVIVSGLVALSGVLYLLFASGAFGVGKRRVEDDETLRR